VNVGQQRNIFWSVRPPYGMLRHLKVHFVQLVQHHIPWPGRGSCMPYCEIYFTTLLRHNSSTPWSGRGESETAEGIMASAVARAYNGGLEAEPPSGVQGQSPWSGDQGAKPHWSWKLFGFWTSNVSSKICLIRLTVADSINHMYENLTTMAWTIIDINFW